MTVATLVEPLAAADRRASLPVLLGSICLLIGSCSDERQTQNASVGEPAGGGATQTTASAVALRGQHYLLKSGQLVAVDEARLAAAVAAAELRPWTVQTRLVASRALEGDTYLAVNGWGFVRVGDLSTDDSEAVPFEYFYARELFAQRTLTHLFEWDGELTGHVYVNHVLAEQAVPDEVAERGNLVRLRDGQLLSVASPHKAVAPAWQSVAVAQVATNEALLEWKLEDRGGIHFQYTLLTLKEGGAREVAVSRELFLSGYQFRGVSDPAVPPQLRGLATSIVALGQGDGDGRPNAYHFVLGDAAGAPIRLRYQPDEATQLRTVPVVAGGGGYLALLGDRGLLNATPPLPASLRLPPLPEGLRYVDLHSVSQRDGGQWLLLVWERVRFYQVGAAGVTLLPLDGGLPSPALGRG